jgi:hypothetical protein
MKAWKTMSPAIQMRSPESFEEWLSTSFWWGMGQNTIGPGFSKERATQLHNAGLKWNRSAWDFLNLTIITGIQAKARFGLQLEECHLWAGLR